MWENSYSHICSNCCLLLEIAFYISTQLPKTKQHRICPHCVFWKRGSLTTLTTPPESTKKPRPIPTEKHRTTQHKWTRNTWKLATLLINFPINFRSVFFESDWVNSPFHHPALKAAQALLLHSWEHMSQGRRNPWPSHDMCGVELGYAPDIFPEGCKCK